MQLNCLHADSPPFLRNEPTLQPRPKPIQPKTLRINEQATKGSLLGTLIGDTIGLPYEGLKNPRGLKLLPFPLRQRLIFNRGIPSDDSIQSFLLIQALLESNGDEQTLKKLFAKRLRIWFLAIPPGIGMATIKACLKLCLGISPNKSGVNSGGNGAAMRAAPLGAALCDYPELRRDLTRASALVTHTHPLAIEGAQLIALAAALEALGQVDQFDHQAKEISPQWPWDQSWPEIGPTGYVVHSVNAVIALWKEHREDPRKAIEEAIKLGGDTDSVGAMLGGILGANPVAVWPEEWKKTLGWPKPSDLEDLSLKTPYLRIAATHATSLPAILLFGLRRLLPPLLRNLQGT